MSAVLARSLDGKSYIGTHAWQQEPGKNNKWSPLFIRGEECRAQAYQVTGFLVNRLALGSTNHGKHKRLHVFNRDVNGLSGHGVAKGKTEAQSAGHERVVRLRLGFLSRFVGECWVIVGRSQRSG